MGMPRGWRVAAALACLAGVGVRVGRAGPAQDEQTIKELISSRGGEALATGNMEPFLAICTDDIVFSVSEGEEVIEIAGKAELRRFLAQNPPPRRRRETPPSMRVAILGDQAVSILDILMPGRRAGFVRAVLRWQRTEEGWRCFEYIEADVEPGMAEGGGDQMVWPAQPGVGLPLAPADRNEVAELATEAVQELEQTPQMAWCNTRMVLIRPNGSGTTVAATLHRNDGKTARRSFGYNTSRPGEEVVYDSAGNKLEVRKALRNPNAPGRYRVDVVFMQPLPPGGSEITYSLDESARLVRERGEEWHFQWRNYPGNACIDTCRVKLPASLEVVDVVPRPTQDTSADGGRAITWRTLVPEGGRVNNIIRLMKPE